MTYNSHLSKATEHGQADRVLHFGENEMSKQRDDTTDENEPSGEERDRRPGSYYYDDSTGYEVYDPEKDDEEDEENAEGADSSS
jgi:hypothetical protein